LRGIKFHATEASVEILLPNVTNWLKQFLIRFAKKRTRRIRIEMKTERAIKGMSRHSKTNYRFPPLAFISFHKQPKELCNMFHTNVQITSKTTPVEGSLNQEEDHSIKFYCGHFKPFLLKFLCYKHKFLLEFFVS
jgi:hypothetical protein